MTGAAVKECRVQRSLTEITNDLMNDNRPGGADGCSNVDRIAYIVEVLGVSEIDLNMKFDFSSIIECKDIETVEACKHLALLQLDYINRAHYHFHLSTEDLNLHTSVLILAIQKINWHLHHLGMDRRTPPFPFIH